MSEPSDAERTADGDAAENGHDGDSTETSSTRLRELGSYIRDQRNRAQYSLRHLARIAGVSNPYLSQIERGLRKPSAEILQAIAKALQISSETLYVKAGFLEDREDLPDLEAAILREDSLTERQRAALIEVYRSFKHENELEGATRTGSAATVEVPPDRPSSRPTVATGEAAQGTENAPSAPSDEGADDRPEGTADEVAAHGSAGRAG